MTFVITRVIVLRFHDMKNYGNFNENSITLIGLIRKKFGVDIHHFHFGILILITIFPIIYIYGINNLLIIIFGISLSLIADQLVPILNKDLNYFDKGGIFASVFLHFLIIIVAIIFSIKTS